MVGLVIRAGEFISLEKSGDPVLTLRTEFERERDLALMEQVFFTPEEMSLLAIVNDIILPADEKKRRIYTHF